MDLIIILAGFIGLWVRIEIRLTRLETRLEDHCGGHWHIATEEAR